eukprot:807919-Lingulodinium_polyedra.AAC.1
MRASGVGPGTPVRGASQKSRPPSRSRGFPVENALVMSPSCSVQPKVAMACNVRKNPSRLSVGLYVLSSPRS